MLLEFTLKNYGPFRDEAVLSLVKDSGDEHPDNSVTCPGTDSRVLTSAAVFGLNSSGKSRVFMAIGDLIRIIGSVPAPNSSIPFYNPFRLSRDSLGGPTEMNIRFTADGVRYEYGISFDSERIVSEHLYSYPRGRVTRVFDRDGQTFSFRKRDEPSMRRMSDMTPRNTPFLTMAAQLNNQVCQSVHLYLTRRIVVIGDAPMNLLWEVLSRVSNDGPMKDSMVRALGIADFGISDIVGESRRADADEIPGLPPQLKQLLESVPGTGIVSSRLEMRHDFPDADVDESLHYFPYSIESRGTLQMFSMMGPVIEALRDGGVVLFDEFGSSLHTAISRWIIGQFSAPSNPNGAQLLINTHDLMLMDTEMLFRRDQIYFTNKDRGTGAAELYSLSDFKGVRKDLDVLKSYLSGRFDAIPEIDRGDLL